MKFFKCVLFFLPLSILVQVSAGDELDALLDRLARGALRTRISRNSQVDDAQGHGDRAATEGASSSSVRSLAVTVALHRLSQEQPLQPQSVFKQKKPPQTRSVRTAIADPGTRATPATAPAYQEESAAAVVRDDDPTPHARSQSRTTHGVGGSAGHIFFKGVAETETLIRRWLSKVFVISTAGAGLSALFIAADAFSSSRSRARRTRSI